MALQTPGVGGSGAASYVPAYSPREFPQTDGISQAAGGIARVMEILQARKREKALEDIWKNAGPGIEGYEQARDEMRKHGLWQESIAMDDKIAAAQREETEVSHIAAQTDALTRGIDLREAEFAGKQQAAAEALLQAELVSEQVAAITKEWDQSGGDTEDLADMLRAGGFLELADQQYDIANDQRQRELDAERIAETGRHNRENEAIDWARLEQDQRELEADATEDDGLTEIQKSALNDCRDQSKIFERQMAGSLEFSKDTEGAKRSRSAINKSCRPIVAMIEDPIKRCKEIRRIDGRIGNLDNFDPVSEECAELDEFERKVTYAGEMGTPDVPAFANASISDPGSTISPQVATAPPAPGQAQTAPGQAPGQTSPGGISTGMNPDLDEVDAILRAGGV